MRYWLLGIILLVASNSFGEEKLTNKAIENYLKLAETAVLKKDVDSLMTRIAKEATLTMYEEHNGEIKHYHFDRDSYKKMMLESFNYYPNMKKYKIINIKTEIDKTGKRAVITYDLSSTVLSEGTMKDYLTKSTEEVVLRNGKILLVNYESIMKY